MNKKQLIVSLIFIICLCPIIANAKTFEEMLLHRPNKSSSFWGYNYEHIKWAEHIPLTTESDIEEGYSGQIDKGIVDLDGDKKEEIIKVIWGAGVSDHTLTIELYKDSEMHQLISRFNPSGIQPNFKLEDLDSDGKLEVILWGAVADPDMSQDVTDTSKPFEGHSDSHLFEVYVYKLDRDRYNLWKKYVTKKKYEPFFTWEQKGLPE